MTTPSQLPTVTPAQPTTQQVTPEVVKVAGRLVRTKSFVSRQLKTTVPAFATGVVTTLVVSRRRKQDDDVNYDTLSDSSE